MQYTASKSDPIIPSNSGEWKDVEKDVKMPYNMKTTPILIMTSSAAGSGDFVYVDFSTSGGEDAGYVLIEFAAEVGYSIGGCTDIVYGAVPPERDEIRIWQISKLPGPRMVLQCNGATVADIPLSDGKCKAGWENFWNKEVNQIEFPTNFKHTNLANDNVSIWAEKD